MVKYLFLKRAKHTTFDKFTKKKEKIPIPGIEPRLLKICQNYHIFIVHSTTFNFIKKPTLIVKKKFVKKFGRAQARTIGFSMQSKKASLITHLATVITHR